MNRFFFLKLAVAACVVALLACGLKILFKDFQIGFRYANAEQYTAGGAEVDGAVKSLDIHWTDGAVDIAYHDKDTVEISETAAKPISGDAALRWWLDGSTLRVQYAKSGFRTFRSLGKRLTVTLPEGLALEDVNIDVISGNVTVPDLRAGSVAVDLTSGNLALRQSGQTERMALSSTSGRISMEASEIGKLSVSVTSGKIQTTFVRAQEATLSTVSGDIALNGGDVRKVDIDSTSGKVDVTLAAFEDLRIKATSGGVSAALPSKPGFRASVSTTSGRFDSAVALTRDGAAYACGDGSGQVRIDTTFGNVRLTDSIAQ